jgi:hypothetical protein
LLLSAKQGDGYNSGMLRALGRGLFALLLVACLAMPVAAQPPQKSPNPEPSAGAADLRPKENTDSYSTAPRLPIFQYILAIGGTALVLFILCMPTRKR